MLNLDTHVLLYAVTGGLRPVELRLLRNDTWSISAIVLWEIAKLARLRRIAVDLDDPEVVRVLARLHVWPVTRDRALLRSRIVPLAAAGAHALKMSSGRIADTVTFGTSTTFDTRRSTATEQIT